MGAEAYTWITKYKEDLAEALENARQETFAAGKFLGAEDNPSTIEEAMEYDPEGGTGSLLEIMEVSETPELLCACWLPKNKLLEFFGTERPSFEEIKQCMPFWESFDRGEARAIVLYENDQPAKICFAAWTIDNMAVGNGSFEDATGDRIQKPKAVKQSAPSPSAEERAADLEFIKGFMTRYGKGGAPENMTEYMQNASRMTEIMLKYESDMGFFREMLAFCPNPMPGMFGGGGK